MKAKKVRTGKRGIFKCALMRNDDKCKSQCDDCKWAVRNMRAGKWQNIFNHWTNNI